MRRRNGDALTQSALRLSGNSRLAMPNTVQDSLSLTWSNRFRLAKVITSDGTSVGCHRGGKCCYATQSGCSHNRLGPYSVACRQLVNGNDTPQMTPDGV